MEARKAYLRMRTVFLFESNGPELFERRIGKKSLSRRKAPTRAVRDANLLGARLRKPPSPQMMPSSLPTLVRISTARSRCSRVCRAITPSLKSDRLGGTSGAITGEA